VAERGPQELVHGVGFDTLPSKIAMFQLMINEKGGQSTSQSFDKNEITIGRVQGNDVVLPKGNISKRHSRIVLKDGKFIIVDLKSTNGTYVNGKKITAPQVIKATDKIYIGDYTLQLTNGGVGVGAAPDARDVSKAGAKPGRDEVDLFGDQSGNEEGAEAPAQKAGSPGLIDENFDQEFDVGADAPPKKPAAAAAKSRLPAAKAPEPEPAPEEDQQELDLASDFPQGEEEHAPELDVEPELPKAPVVPMKPPVKKGLAAASAAPQPRVAPSKVKGSQTPAPVLSARGRPAASDDDALEMGLDEPPDASEGAHSFGQAGPDRKMPAAVVPIASAQSLGSIASPAAAPMPATVPAMGAMTVAAVGASERPLDRMEALRALHHVLVEELGLRSYDLGALSSMKDRAVEAAKKIIQRWQQSGRISSHEDVENLAKAAASRALDLDLIVDLYHDDEVLQIAVTPDRQIWAERDSFKPEGRIISSEDQVIDLILRLGVLGGADPGPDAPLIDVRLRDGARVIASIPPLAFRGPTLSIRKATRDWYNFDSFVESGTLNEAMVKFLDICIRAKKNMLLSLGPGVSGSATLNAIVSQFADDERVVTIENGVELHLGNLKNATAFEPSPELPLDLIVRHATMMLPDRVVVGNLSGDSLLDVLKALAGPLDGSVCACFAPNPHAAIDRMMYELRPDIEEPIAAKKLIGSAFAVLLQEHRFPEGGSRRITSISEIVVDGEDLGVHEVFVFRPEGVDENGVITGSFAPTGHEPRFVQELVERGDEIDMEIFKE
jgi:pilus assembly protein CpaF